MRKYTVLIVDDEPHQLLLLRKSLEREACYEVRETSDPRKALLMLREHPADIIISDHHMPEMTGLELLGLARTIAPAAIRIITTGLPDGVAIREAHRQGLIHHYIAKPWDREAFMITLENTLTHLHLQNEKQRLARELSEKIHHIRDLGRESENFAELKKQFMMIANHELRTPASIITASLDLLASRHHGLDTTQLKFITNALGGARRMNELLEKCFTILRYEQAPPSPGLKRIDLAGLLRRTVCETTEAAARRNITLEVDCQAGLNLAGTAEHLLQVFDNLLSNAIKYTPDGGHIRICARETDGQVLIAVRDNGIGIPDGELENIFKDFYQLSDARNHHSSKYEFLGGGAGLGLSLCRSIVKAHLGDIWAESEGQYLGSTFFVRLPLNGTPEKAVRPMLEARRFERYQERQAV